MLSHSLSAVIRKRYLPPRLLCSANNNNVQNLATLQLSLDTWVLSTSAAAATSHNVLDSSSCVSTNMNQNGKNKDNVTTATGAPADFWMHANSEKLTRLMPSLMCERKGKRQGSQAVQLDDELLLLDNNDNNKLAHRQEADAAFLDSLDEEVE